METELTAVDSKIERLFSKKNDWLAVTIKERIALLERIAEDLTRVSAKWAELGALRKGANADDPICGEEWLAGPVTTMRNVRLLIETLKEDGQPRVKTFQRNDGQWVARVFPQSLMDRAMLPGVSADVWIEPGKMPTRGAIYREPKKSEGRVALVLGAGNVSSIPPMDVLYKLFAEDEVVLLKMNPVNEDVGPCLEEAFATLIEKGFLEIIYGGAEVGAHAANHAQIGSLHVTGSDKTYDAIVWGKDDDERARRKKENTPLNAKPFSAELGCVTPVLVVPGPWSESDIDYQARHVAAMVTQNASFNCNAAKVLVLPRGWLQREAFLTALDGALTRARPRKPYYPGAKKRYDGFTAHYPQARALGKQMDDDAVPWTIIDGVSPEPGEYALTNEAFCGVLAVVTLDLGDVANGRINDPPHIDAPRFLKRAVAFANDACWGTLSCCLLAHPDTLRAHADAVDRAVADLRYGGIGINCWPGLIYGLVSPTWGAFPGHTPDNIMSGQGVVHNTTLLDHPQKSVVSAPFHPLVAPPYFSDIPTLRDVGMRLFNFERAPTWKKIYQVARAFF